MVMLRLGILLELNISERKGLSDGQPCWKLSYRSSGVKAAVPSDALSHRGPRDRDANFISFISPSLHLFGIKKAIMYMCLPEYSNITQMYKKCKFSYLLPPHHSHPVDVTALNPLVCSLLGLSIGTHGCFIYLADYNYVFPKVIHSQYGKYTKAFF